MTASLSRFYIYKKSEISLGTSRFLLLKNSDNEKYLYVEGEKSDSFNDPAAEVAEGCIFPLTNENAYQLAGIFPWLKPQKLGRKKAFGFGDRIGLAAPGHLKSIEKYDVKPVLAQQSIREMDRVNRSPEDVIASSIWGAFERNYTGGFGADADHLKTEEDVKKSAAAGFKMFTCDPGAEVYNISNMSEDEILKIFNGIECSDNLLDKYLDRSFLVKSDRTDDEFELTFNREDVIMSSVKYFYAVEKAIKMYFQLRKEFNGNNFDYEISVDETASPTTPKEHLFIVRELIDKEVEFESIAPRFRGDFEKGIDYKGEIGELKENLKIHSAIAESFGNYKLSFHSGSDKFSIYPLISEILADRYHVKTSGTSYLEAVRVAASKKPEIFNQIYDLSRINFPEARKSYNISAQLEKVPELSEIDAEDYPGCLDRDEIRQVLHVTYGSILEGDEISKAFYQCLQEYDSLHYNFLSEHLDKHLNLLEQQERRK